MGKKYFYIANRVNSWNTLKISGEPCPQPVGTLAGGFCFAYQTLKALRKDFGSKAEYTKFEIVQHEKGGTP